MEEIFWEASPAEMRKGFIYDNGRYICLVCGAWHEEGVIYQSGTRFLDAGKAAVQHVSDEHGSMEERILSLSKKQTGLSDVQSEVMARMLKGETDDTIAEGLGFTSVSTVRQYRFKFREKARQARVLLALMESVEQNRSAGPAHRGAKMVDERWETTEAEAEKFLSTYIDPVSGKIKQFPRKEKRKIVILKYLTRKFDPSATYTEKEVSELLEKYYDDFATLRRYLIEYGFMKRNQDGSRYYVDPAFKS
ncbi:transcriptional regulator [Alteribacter lacisalsi]|uniref:Transcriptional regulator n=1 Tax=Alteribacter lacisalsi TaxID=2045244 RepID=A0A2W0H9F1_9BACI|nr:DUF2087 domain-containing protein [Alteribacter lacisalsi]PYZ97396.1 transcriptional regulator [Alteribacter lacisalsi]